MADRVSVEIVCTAVGVVRLSQKVIDFLDKNAPDRNNLRDRKGKDKKLQKKVVKEVENAIRIAAWIEWSNGGVLEEY